MKITTTLAKYMASLVAVALLCVGCSGDDERLGRLKVYNWGDYIDEELLVEFEEWYAEQTGEEVEVVYQTFDINEVMLAKIENGHADFDVVCPSEYIIERMLRKELLLPILTEEFKAEIKERDIDYFGAVSPYIKEQFSLLTAVEGVDPNDYSVGYMWGTTGILYNKRYVTEEEALSWGLMFSTRLQDKIFVKDAFRDVYSTMLIYAKTLEQREAGLLGEDEYLSLDTIRELMYDSSDESIALVESYLKRMKELVAGWEADFGKEMMTQEKAWINLMWSGDAVWAIDEATSVDVELGYAVPKEGSVVWFDGWVIPKYARNTRAARYFIDFMCKPENAIRNMSATGYVSVVATEEVFDALEELSTGEMEECDLSYLFIDENGESLEGSECVMVDAVLYPDRSIIERSGVMHDSGDRTDKMLEMWSRVKGDNLSTGMLVGIILFFSLLLIWGIWRKIDKYRTAQRYAKRRRHHNRVK
ncbi:MAG: ABC transporter substrate-binding protein [Alistipes sp.]|nr:ABC transporter substrate-binding protein [Alistipes sp.]MBR6544208.1 ABC transporter substrate-binding protein [Alistipes sp.]